MPNGIPLAIQTRLNMIICLACAIATLPGEVLTHVKKCPAVGTLKVAIRTSIKNAIASHPDLEKEYPKKSENKQHGSRAFGGILLYSRGLCCPVDGCRFATSSLTVFNNHRKSKQHSKSIKPEFCFMQRLNKCSPWFKVTTRSDEKGCEVHLASKPRYMSDVSFQAPNSTPSISTLHPYLHETGIYEFLKPWYSSPEGREEVFSACHTQIVCQKKIQTRESRLRHACNHYIKSTSDSVSRCPIMVRKIYARYDNRSFG